MSFGVWLHVRWPNRRVPALRLHFTARFVHPGGCECIAHVLQALCDLNPQTTVTSVNGVTAYDLFFRRATSTGFRHVDGGSASLSFVRMFHGSPSECLWEDDSGVTKIWNKGGLRPGVCEVLERAARDRNHRPVCGGVQVCQWRSEASRYCHPDRPPRTCSQILGHFVRRAPDLAEPDPFGRRRASSFAPPSLIVRRRGRHVRCGVSTQRQWKGSPGGTTRACWSA